MTKQEFEQRLGKTVSESKDQIAYLYKTFGMRIIEDMIPTARKARERSRTR